MTIFNVISLFGGIALFLYGMRIMGDGLRQSSSKAFKRALGKVTNNALTAFLLGLGVTAIIQSSTATIVITSGLVGAGLLNLRQSLGIILGANVGTTITGQIIRLMDISGDGATFLQFFKPSTLAPIASLIGILMIMVFKSDNSKKVGEIAMGFGILFTGLLSMSAAVSPLSSSPTFAKLFIQFGENPILGFITGAAVAFLLQSSSATIGILQTLTITGQLTLGSTYAIIIGIYIGDCVTTAIVCSIGAKSDAKRIGVVHILFNLCEVVLITTAMFIIQKTGLLGSIWNNPLTSGGIANIHTIFNLSCAIIILPFVGLLEKASQRIVKDDARKNDTRYEAEQLLDSAFYRNPTFAFTSASTCIASLATAAIDNFHRSLGMLLNYSEDPIQEILKTEDYIDHMTDVSSNYLIKLAPLVDFHGNEIVNYNIKCAEEFERIADLSINIMENAQTINEKDSALSGSAKREIQVLGQAIDEILGYTIQAYRSRDMQAAKHVEPIEEVIDELCERLRNRHVDRLKAGICNAITGSQFLNLLVNIERISDQCSNIAVHTISLKDPTIANKQHEYLNSLHNGSDEKFNAEYANAKTKYFALLEEAEYEG